MGGMANFMLPPLFYVPDMIFPRLNNMSFWVFFGGVFFLVCGVFTEDGIGCGWTLYPPLSCWDFHASLSMDFTVASVHLLGISSILNSINIISTSFSSKSVGASFYKAGLFAFASVVTSFLLILVVPVLAVGVTLIFLDRNINSGFLDSSHAGDEIIFQHVF